MAKLLKDKIQFKSGKFYFDIHFYSGFTLISGDSATGKTLFFNSLRQLVIADNMKGYLFVNHKDLVDVNPIESVLQKIKRNTGSVILIDDGDVVLKGLQNPWELISQDMDNQYIVFGRNIDYFNITSTNYAELVEDNKQFRLDYIYKGGPCDGIKCMD